MSNHTVTLLLGSNLGDRFRNLEIALQKIENDAGKIEKKSEILQSKPVEFASCNIFCNIAVSINTRFSPINLLKLLKNIEQNMGRLRDSGNSETYEDRIIDIDIVTFGNINFHCDQLNIPHQKHLYQREFSSVLLDQLK